MQAPAYRDVAPQDVPAFETAEGVVVRVIAGRSEGIDGAVTRPTTEPIVLDVTLPAGSHFDVKLPAGHNAFAYVAVGPLAIGGEAPTLVDAERMAILGNEEGAVGVRLSAPAGTGPAARVLVVAGRPLGEPIAQYGPFVMNTTAELQRAVSDYQRGALAV
jgi:redox-sensitive bicupin YhaK (pirin superfamily)